jgi:hypothetical protein
MMAARADQHARQGFSTSKAHMQACRAKDCDERHNVRRAWKANISFAADIRSERDNIRSWAAAKEGRREKGMNQTLTRSLLRKPMDT